MATLPQQGDPVEEPVNRRPSFMTEIVQWGLLPLLLGIFGIGLVLEYFL